MVDSQDGSAGSEAGDVVCFWRGVGIRIERDCPAGRFANEGDVAVVVNAGQFVTARGTRFEDRPATFAKFGGYHLHDGVALYPLGMARRCEVIREARGAEIVNAK